MAKTVIIDEFGGPEVLQLRDLAVGDPGPGEIRIRQSAAGLNFIDVYQRSGLYPNNLPLTLGMEGAGIVEAVGEGVSHLKEGDRAAYAALPPGAYAEARVMPAAHVVRLPDAIGFDEAASAMLQGMTVEYLFHRTTPLKSGDTVLFHAAAGGVGLLACQWARSEGITLIGTAGTDEKCALAVEHGATQCINYQTEDFTAKVKEFTDGRGVDVVMDSVGRDTFIGSLDSLRTLGMLISFGAASGPVEPFTMSDLATRGSLKVTRPMLFHHFEKEGACQEMAAHLFDKLESGAVKTTIGARFALDDIRAAHEAMEARKTTGSTIIGM
ncbi:quinone oxidoreductase family protein [Rhodalgimonas zhirmunskyi]|uniref:Quinone oxidoreductase n=1 Tax=Rhodalgimonas zhirmunskyi TaxID=2964767 RepID=A0AAJ1UDS8_9RHOB|nr:quinone oxidoreductase [Rhodoalgimonas zhirmunskyi]MDQ2094481.1 quinone oxidoreductase [Rhodoalgimonas zhirmunskyi]